MFQLTKEEQANVEKFLRSQFVTIEIANEDLRGRHSKYLSYAFTEQGVAMLASVLKSDSAVLTSILLMLLLLFAGFYRTILKFLPK